MKTNNQAKPKASEVHYWLYSTGNFANNIIFMMVGTYITYFYTNILGISPAMAGLVFMVARLVDAFTDPLMGIIVDKTNTKIGKYRPWIIAGAPFLGIMFVLLFTAPNFSMTGKVVYAFITYIIYSWHGQLSRFHSLHFLQFLQMILQKNKNPGNLPGIWIYCIFGSISMGITNP